MAEGRAQKQFVPVPPHKILMRAARLRRQGVNHFLKPLVPAVEGGDDPGSDGIQNGALLFGLFTRRFQSEFQLLQPAPHTGEVGLDISNEHLELV